MAKREPRKRKDAGGGKRRFVYHVFHWDQRYAVNSRDWPAERGLLFVRQFVAPVDTESSSYFGQLQDLRALAKDDPTYHLFKSLWEDLRALCATQGRIHQGYLIDEQQQPLNEAQIAVRLRTGEELTRRVLKALCTVTLVERIVMPSFADIKRQQDDRERQNAEQNDSSGAQNRTKRRSCAQNSAESANCSTMQAAKIGPDAFEKGDSGPPGEASVPVVPASDAAIPLKGNGLNGNGNPNQNEKAANGQAEGQAQTEGTAQPSPSRTKGNVAAEPSPPATQPIKPKGAESGEGREETVRHAGSDRPPRSLSPKAGTLGAAGTQMIRKLSGDAQSFAEWVYTKLGLLEVAPVNSEPWRLQVAAIGFVWALAETQLPSDQLESFRQWAYVKAEDRRAHAAEFRNHVAKWMSDAKFEIRKRKKKAMRAPP